MKVLFINSVCGVGSTGRICAEQAKALAAEGHEVMIAYGRGDRIPEELSACSVRIGTDLDWKIHALATRVLDRHGSASKRATKRFLAWAESFDPDLIWLHNIHGYYIHIPMLFRWIKSRPQTEVKWTLHDCWSFTGHCSYFTMAGCEKWRVQCEHCPQKGQYPASMVLDRSARNYKEKKALFTGVARMTLIAPSAWLAGLVKESFLREYPVEVCYNTVNTEVFLPTPSDFRERHGLKDQKVILGVAGQWDARKGLSDFVKLADMLDERFRIVLVGLSDEQIRTLPYNIVGIGRTGSPRELAEIYTAADLFFNPTYEDNYPTVNLEAEACGTPVLTYGAGGAAETLKRPDSTVIPVGDIDTAYEQILSLWDGRKHIGEDE